MNDVGPWLQGIKLIANKIIKMKRLTILLFIAFLFSCTENQNARKFGGKASIDLPVGQKLVIVTWKDDNLWYCTRPMTDQDSAVTYTFHEESSFGIWEGTYTIKETK